MASDYGSMAPPEANKCRTPAREKGKICPKKAETALVTFIQVFVLAASEETRTYFVQ